MKWWYIVVLGSACGKTGDRGKPKPVVFEDAAALVATKSLPRPDWPTGMVVYSKSTLAREVHHTFHYDSDAPCAMSAEAQWHGIVGCPSRVTHTYENGSSSEDAIVYDAGRHVVEDQMLKWTWNGDTLATRFKLRYRKVTLPYANVAVWRESDNIDVARLKIENGRVLALYDANAAAGDPAIAERRRVEFTWNGARLARIDDSTTRTYLEYADTPVTSYPEDAERKQREVADHDIAKLGTASSVPRDAWPCAVDIKFADGTGRVLAFTYGERTACKLPLDVATEGVVGCPTVLETRERAADGTLADPVKYEFRYAEDGRLLAGYATPRWRDDGLVAHTGTLARTATGFEVVADDVRTTYELRDGKLVAMRTESNGMSVTASLTWDKNRLTRLAGTSFVETANREGTVSYACP